MDLDDEPAVEPALADLDRRQVSALSKVLTAESTASEDGDAVTAA
ncbi:hypothetical protein [Dactylosporangium sp. NPDC051541]